MSETPTWLTSVDIAGAERTLWKDKTNTVASFSCRLRLHLQLMNITLLAESSYFTFSPSSLHCSDIYRCESGRCRTLPFFLTLLSLNVIHKTNRYSSLKAKYLYNICLTKSLKLMLQEKGISMAAFATTILFLILTVVMVSVTLQSAYAWLVMGSTLFLFVTLCSYSSCEKTHSSQWRRASINSDSISTISDARDLTLVSIMSILSSLIFY